MTKIKTKDLPTDLLAFVRKIWNPGAEGDIWQDGDRYTMETTLQHVDLPRRARAFACGFGAGTWTQGFMPRPSTG